METVKRYFRIDRRQIAFVKFIFEAYDGIAMMSTEDAAAGKIVFRIPPGCEGETETLLSALEKEVMIVPLDAQGEEIRVS